MYWSGTYKEGDVIRSFSTIGATNYVTYHINSLNPAVSASIYEPLYLQETKLNPVYKVNDKYLLSFIILFSVNFQISISSSSIAHQDYDFSVSVIASESIDNLLSNFKRQVILREMEQFRSESSFLSYLGVLLFANKEHDAVLIFPHNKKLEEGKAVLYHPNSDEIDYKTVWYKIASWDRLI